MSHTSSSNISSSVSVRILVLSLSTYSDSRITIAKESRQHYTLNPIPGMTITPPLLSAIPQPSPAQVPGSIGPIRKTRKARPNPTRVSKHPPANGASPTNPNAPQLESPNSQSPQINVSKVRVPQSNTPQPDVMPTEPGEPVFAPIIVAAIPHESDGPTTTITPAGSGGLATATAPPDGTPPPARAAPDDDTSDGVSYTSTISDFFDVGSDNTGPPATGPWMIIDHLTGETICDDNQSIDPVPTTQATPAAPATPALPGVETAIAPRLGTTYLVETSPTLLSEDEDVRPQWLMTAVNSFFRFVPCIGSLGKVIDLYLAQEARLGYPELVCAPALWFLPYMF